MTIRKNMLFVAGIVTLSFATFLVWIDNALANYIETRPILALEIVEPKATQPGADIYPTPEKIPTLPLPEVCISARKSKTAGATCIP